MYSVNRDNQETSQSILGFMPFELEFPGYLAGFPLGLQPIVPGGLASILLGLAFDDLRLVLGLLAQTHNQLLCPNGGDIARGASPAGCVPG
jgi:hypothetical protein